MDETTTILPREINYEWSRELSRAAARRYFSRRFRQPLIVLSVFCALFIVALIFEPHSNPAASFMPLFGFAFCLSPVLLLVRVYFSMTKSFDELPDNRIRVRIESESITFETCESISTMKWRAIKQLWKFSDVWLLSRYKTKTTCFVLPVTQLDEAISKAIEEKVKQHGGRVA